MEMDMNDEEKNETLGKVLHDARDKLKEMCPEKFTVRQFAKIIGLSPAFLSKLENGSIAPPSPEKLILIARKLGLDPNRILVMAKKIDPELKDIVIKRQVEMAGFLRTVDSLSSQHFHFLIEQAEMYKEAENAEGMNNRRKFEVEGEESHE